MYSLYRQCMYLIDRGLDLNMLWIKLLGIITNDEICGSTKLTNIVKRITAQKCNLSDTYLARRSEER